MQKLNTFITTVVHAICTSLGIIFIIEVCCRSLQNLTLFKTHIAYLQHAKKVVSDNPGPVDFAIGLVNCLLNLPNKQVKFF